MAYFHVVNQSDKSKDIGPFYQSVEGNQSVQYVIAQEDQQFQTQQIVVTSGDQVMVVDGQPQVIIDQSQIAYQQQPQQYVIQETQGIEFQGNRQQIFYMEDNSNNQGEQVIVEQAVQVQQTIQQGQPQPIVLNHQIGSPMVVNRPQQPQQQQKILLQTNNPQVINSLRMSMTSRPHVPQPRAPIHQAPNLVVQPRMQGQVRITPQGRTNSNVRPQGPVRQQIAQIRQQLKAQQTQHLQQMKQLNNMTQPRPQDPPRVGGSPPRLQNNTSINQPQPSLNDQEVPAVDYEKILEANQETITMPDGTPVPVEKYKKLCLTGSIPEQVQNRIAAEALDPSLVKVQTGRKRATKAASPRKPKNPNPKPRKPAGQGKGGKGKKASNDAPEIAVTESNTPKSYAPPTKLQQQAQPVYRPNQTNQNPSQPQCVPQQQQQQYQMQQGQNIQQNQPPPPKVNQANYLIQPNVNSRPQQQRPLPSYIPSSQIKQIIENTPACEEYSDSIRMLVLLANGEQRLITFTLPKEACTIQEILEQVNVPFQSDTNIEVTETNSNGINYIVTVGHVRNFNQTVHLPEPGHIREDESSQIQQVAPAVSNTQESEEPPTPLRESPPLKEPTPPRIVPGKLALCNACGYTSEDFNKCMRCKRKLPENVKAIAADLNRLRLPLSKFSSSPTQNNLLAQARQISTNITSPSNGNNNNNSITKKKPRQKVVDQEPVVLTLSSDDEGEEDTKPIKCVSEALLEKLGSSVSLVPVGKEPSMNDIKKVSPASIVKDEKAPSITTDKSLVLFCRTVRIGSYRFIPPNDVQINQDSLIITAPVPNNEKEKRIIKISRNDMVKVLVCFHKQLPVIFYYVRPSVGQSIREALNMTEGSDMYFDPISEEEPHKRITLLPENLNDGIKNVFSEIYGSKPYSIMDELNTKEANDILIKTCPRDITKLAFTNFTEVKQLLTYPPEGRGRITINTEDYLCLAQDQFLNDVIIDFYIKYVVEHLPKEQQSKIHAFSTFFYNRLTTKPLKASRKSQPSELDNSLSPAQRRHARVKTWTKNVNLFEKDFIIVPINENCHWFLAIICFPGMNGPHTFSGESIYLEPRKKKENKITSTSTPPTPTQIGHVTITTVTHKKPKPQICDEAESSDKDEAEGDDSELESDDSEEIPAAVPTPTLVQMKDRPPIKQPCILVFDSLSGTSRSKVVATLRDYLTCEYKAKLNIDKVFDKEVIKGANPKVPQQTNFTDCGLYLLQYVEHFLKEQPITDYYIPMKQLQNWFQEITVTKKREDIANLIKDLMTQYNKNINQLPEITFPTLNGKIVDHAEEEDPEGEFEDSFMEEEENMGEEEEEVDEEESIDELNSTNNSIETHISEDALLKPSNEGGSTSSKNDIIQQDIVNSALKPDISEFPRTTTNRDTLSYLKSKRIIRHKNSDGPEIKKQKNSE